MILRSTNDHGRYDRCSHAAADVSREIHQPRNRIALVFADSDVSRSRGWHEDKSHWQILVNAKPRCRRKAQQQIDSLRGYIHADGKSEPAKCDEVTRLKLSNQAADKRQLKQ